jgi:hypothetical protein
MYPDILLYPFGIMRVFAVSMLTAYRLCMICVNAATVIVAYLSFRLMCHNRAVVMTAVFVITFEPYRLYNILGRGSGAGNALASVFLPLILAGIYLILKGDKRWWVLSLGLTGVIESHILTLVILVFTLIVLGLTFAGELSKDRKYILLLKSAGLAAVMNLGFLVIFMKCYMTDWNSAALEWSDFADTQYGIASALTGAWSLFQIVSCIICIYFIIRAEDRKDVGYRLSVAMTAVGGCLYIMTLKIFPWKTLSSALPAIDRFTTMLQVPQRLYAMSSVLFICAAVLLIDRHAGGDSLFWKKPAAVTMSALMGAVLIYGIIMGADGYYSASNLMPDEVYGDHNSLALKDYIPSGATDDSWAKDAGFVSDEDAVESLKYMKNGTHIDYTYVSHKDGVYANMPLLYYEWYRAKDEAGRELSVRKSDDARVIVDLSGDGVQHEAHIYFDMGAGYSMLYALSLLISCGAIVIILHKKLYRGGSYVEGA